MFVAAGFFWSSLYLQTTLYMEIQQNAFLLMLHMRYSTPKEICIREYCFSKSKINPFVLVFYQTSFDGAQITWIWHLLLLLSWILVLQSISEVMVVGEIKRSSGFGKPPWIFKGRQVIDFWVFFFLFLFLIKIPIIWLISFPIFSNNKTFHLLRYSVPSQCLVPAPSRESRNCSSMHPERVQISWSFWVLILTPIVSSHVVA